MQKSRYNEVTGRPKSEKSSAFLVLYLGQNERAQVQLDGNAVSERDRLRWATMLRVMAIALEQNRLRPGLYPPENVQGGEWAQGKPPAKEREIIHMGG